MSPGGLCCLRRLFLGRTSLVSLQHTIKVRLQVVTAAETNGRHSLLEGGSAAEFHGWFI